VTVHALFVLTSHGELGSTGRPTGFHLGEAAVPWQRLTRAGHQVDFVSTAGGRPPMVGHDPANLAEAAFLTDPVVRHALDNTPPAAEIDPTGYDVVYFVGGHGGMWDFHRNAALHAIARTVYESGGLIAAICHGPAALVDLELSDGTRLIEGKHLTAFPEADEAARKLHTVVPFSLQAALETNGARYTSGPDKTSHVVSDNRLLTAQNPSSAADFTDQLLLAITRQSV
jgi:putative intracellular protease/amidase